LALAVSAPVDSLPAVALGPTPHAPEEVQDVASVEDQVSVEDALYAIDVGFAASDTVGTGGGGDGGAEPSPPLPPQAERPRLANRAANAQCIPFDTKAPWSLKLISKIPAPEDPVVLRLGPAAVSPMGRDQRNALSSEMLIEWIAVEGTIPDKSLGSFHGEGLSGGSFDMGASMWRSSSRVHGEWKTRSVCNSHALCALAPLRLSHCEAPFSATTKVPSITHCWSVSSSAFPMHKNLAWHSREAENYICNDFQ
jgi:hypothetical protein